MNSDPNASGLSQQEPRKTLVGFLRSDKWAFISFLFIVTPLMVHTSSLIVKVSGLGFGLFPHDELLYSFLFALGFDTAILTFALSGKEDGAKGLAFIVFLLNFGFMNYDFVQQLDSGKVTFSGFHVFQIGIRFIISAAGAYIVHSYVIFFLDRIKDESILKKVFSQKKEMEEKTAKLESEIEEYKENLEHLKAFKANLEKGLPSVDELEQDVSKQMRELYSRLDAAPVVPTREVANKSVSNGKDPKPEANIETISSEAETFECPYCHKGGFKSKQALGGHTRRCPDKP